MIKEIDGTGVHQEVIQARFVQLQSAILNINEILESGKLFQEIVDQACSLTQAQYGALLTFDSAGETGEFVVSGMSPAQASRITVAPKGRGILASLDDDVKPVRIHDIASHSGSVGFPENHPAMTSFLGVPLYHRGRRLANLYLADKETGPEFTSDDEVIIAAFAAQSAVAMHNSARYDLALRAKADLEVLIQLSPIGVLVFDARTGQLVTRNREAERIIGDVGTPDGSWESALNTVSYRRSDGREISLSDQPLARVLRSGETVRAEEVTVILPNGRNVTTLINAAPTYSDQGEIESVIVALQDISPLEELDRMRADFLNLVSHDLRTPLTTIKGSIAALADVITPAGSNEPRQLLGIIDHQANTMRSQINRLIDLTQIESGTLTVNPSVMALTALLEEEKNEFLKTYSGHEFDLEGQPGLPRAMADRQRVSQVLKSLLCFAVKCSPPSSTLKVSAYREDTNVAVTISVEGHALSNGVLDELFGQLSRSHLKEATQAAESDKLALAICRGIVNAHGGRLWCETGEEDLDMTLGFSIPLADETKCHPEGGQRPGTDRPSLAGNGKARILSVVENPRMLNAVQRTLSRSGYVPIGTMNYSELDRLIAEEKPHLVLLDLATPRVRDFDVIQKVTQDYGVPAMVLAGQGDDECIVRAFEMGADDYIVKPFSPTELVARIRASFRKRSDTNLAREREEFVMGDLTISYPERRVSLAGRKVHLTATEYQLLYELSTRAGRVLSQDELLRRIWGEEYMGDIQLLRAFVKTLRQKLGDNARSPSYIFTEHGIGYRMPRP